MIYDIITFDESKYIALIYTFECSV